ncbi:peptide chain release factor N(5)-glutamine methyltransferase [Sphaerobacter thermophilus]|jgi:release factor glutamine methyltransferase|uniref:Release factor glutamine methyltransferase n=1 Tax=Sphaerobacter thermophilus (strain ATCC 49802 / DSM 20745 / KCCM 41009 / NCIMB 13125 / S 6022) TaxID=479434 RepID=D1C517_SPHTD|nr:peptide chain release factor N(5)-glutamine methyltransferase [Sphaerobacter thermophilus]ACZ39334.1 modification methylase, HemK family [Sphaerobacter thermophilus DSM 20745]
MTHDPPTLRQLLHDGRQQLEQAGDETARLDAEVLLRHLLSIDRATLYARLPDPAPPDTVERYRDLIARRAAGEPVAYITGHREFMGLDFLVDRRVLIPRPETEYLVEWALAWLRERGGDRLVVDVGTGSGAIAVSLAAHADDPALRVVGSDRSLDALRVAAINRDRLAPGRVALVAGDLLSWCRPGIDLVLANLPYLRPDQAHAGIAWEPAVALYAGETGFGLYEQLLPQVAQRLRPRGAVGCEIDPSQRAIALATARSHFPTARITVRPDLAGLDRYLIIETD